MRRSRCTITRSACTSTVPPVSTNFRYTSFGRSSPSLPPLLSYDSNRWPTPSLSHRRPHAAVGRVEGDWPASWPCSTSAPGNLNLIYPAIEYGDSPTVEAGRAIRFDDLMLASPAGRVRNTLTSIEAPRRLPVLTPPNVVQKMPFSGYGEQHWPPRSLSLACRPRSPRGRKGGSGPTP